MSPYTIMGWLFAIVFATILLALILPRRKRASVSYGTDDGQADVQQQRVNLINPGELKITKRPVGKVPPYGIRRKPVVTLTPRQVERVNIQRRLLGKPTLNRAGFKNAISAAWDTPRREPASSNDWLTYLIMYEVFFADHQSARCSGNGGFTIDPNLPYNGQGGEFAGGGASGSWTDPSPAVQAMALDIAGGAVAFETDSKYQPGDTVGGYRSDEVPVVLSQGSYSNTPDPATPAPDPTPSYSAPDPSPSYSSSSDSSSSYSSSSSDSGSSSGSSSGGDGGGGGGGD